MVVNYIVTGRKLHNYKLAVKYIVIGGKVNSYYW